YPKSREALHTRPGVANALTTWRLKAGCELSSCIALPGAAAGDLFKPSHNVVASCAPRRSVVERVFMYRQTQGVSSSLTTLTTWCRVTEQVTTEALEQRAHVTSIEDATLFLYG